MLQAWQDKQVTSIPVGQLQSFKGICGTCSDTAAHWQTLAWTAESQPPMQNQGRQSQWKSHFFQLLRGFCALENMCSFLQLSSPRSFLSPYLGRGGSGVTYGTLPEARQHLQVGLKRSKIKLVRWGVVTLIHLLLDTHFANPDWSSAGCVCSLTGRQPQRADQVTLWRAGAHTSSPPMSALWCKTAGRSDCTSSSYEHHLSTKNILSVFLVRRITQDVLVCFSSCWPSVKLLLMLRHHSTDWEE